MWMPGEACGGEFGGVVGLFEGSSDAADPEEHGLADAIVEVATGDDVGDGEAAAGAQDTEGFGEDAVFVGGEIDDAVGEDDVDGVVGQGCARSRP